MTPEGKVKKLVNDYIKSLGDDVWKFMPVQTGYGSPALDYILCIRGKFVAIETKIPGKDLTPLQKETRRCMQLAKGIVLTVYDPHSLTSASHLIENIRSDPHDVDIRRAAKLHNEYYHELFQTKDEGPRKQHVRKLKSAQADEPATGGHHGASGAAPKGHPVPKSRKRNQRDLAGVADGDLTHEEYFRKYGNW